MEAMAATNHILMATQRIVEQGEMFGDRSTIAIPEAFGYGAGGVVTAVHNPVFQLLTILLALSIVMLVRDRYGMKVLIGSLGRRLSEYLVSGSRDAFIPDGFYNMATLTGTIMITVAVSRYAPMLISDALVESEVLKVIVISLFAFAAVVAVGVFQKWMLRFIAAVSRNTEFVDLLASVRRTIFATASVILSPTVLLAALSSGGSRIWFWIFVAECCILAFLLVKETVGLFVDKKIPIFQWFLYLCAVEAFPVSLVCASIARLR